ncbi:MAG: hemagglutinin repeat-containing protein [Gilliamella sp.]|uniref:hemagglutinin repeat-containing protein n=1 Tax=Gilliamella sp. TaxID=1891236 RepID=UPI00263499CB|nr:hemagglutinin repeat-containing protein [Gilliamella sp.]MCO6551420.1 hemagglutinin repeat-containing protein [Gilliamella sp.]
MQGENVNIEALDAKTPYQEEYERKKSGLTVSITGTASDIYNANQTREQAKKQTNEKTKALMNIKAGLQAGNAALEGGANLQNGTPQASIGINVSLGSEKTKRTVNQEQHTVVSSGISAGHNLSIIATGNGQKESGDINIIGSQVSAGHDAMLKANHDVNIIGQENTIKTDSKEKNSSGSVGVGYNFGGEKNGFTISASASQSKSREKGNGTDWTESVVEAGNKLTIITGNDANIVAGQVKGDRVVADIGHDLNIESKQDSDEFHSKSTSTSVGGSFSYGGSSSINASASKTKMDSNWQSVTDQSGIFAGSGGFDIKVGNNTDLKGAVIASEAKDKSQNRLDTGTISFSDIENKADYQVSSSSAGVSSSGMPSMPTSRNKNESEQSTTHSAVSEGTIIIRNKDDQKQDINELSRDTEQANNELKHIFNKQKEQDIIDQTQLVSEIGGETLTMLNHIDRIRAESKAKEAVEKEQEKAADKGIVLTDKQQQKIYEDAYKESMNQGMSAMGSDTRQGIDMAVSIINGLISGDMTGAAAGALAPKIATIIKQQTEGNTVANTVSHAILGAVVAELQGNSALVGGLGAAASERGAEVIAGILYPDKDIKDLSQEERQQISALSQLATGLAIAASGGDIQDVNTGVAAGKNAVENNRLLTPTEKKRIDELVKGNEREDLLYRAAACALIHCSAGLADDDPDKAAYLALEELGNSPELESYREQLKGQTAEIEVELPPYITGGGKESYKKIEELFEYTTGNKISDTMTYYDSEYSISTRAGGTLQVGMAVVDGMAAVALSPGCTTLVGCLPSAYLTWSMVDNGATGLMVIYNGKTYHTQTAEGLSNILGVSASDAELLFSLSTGGVTAKGLSDLAWKSRTTGQKLSAKEVEQISEGINRVKAGKQPILPNGYTPQGANVVGPKGGVYTHTGKFDAAGNPIYTNNGAYYTFENGAKTKVPSPNTGKTTNGRPHSSTSEKDVGASLPQDYRGQVSYKDGVEVPHGTKGSVRPDFCNGTTCSIEVKNYDIGKYADNLINNISKQALERQKHLPNGMRQEVVIDVRGQHLSKLQEFKIMRGIVRKSNGIIKREHITFKRK